ncbi:MAG: contractile injection system tape measure protein [Synechococcaceae cyanobacterium]|nr:contractile injection system tape measure protein [Synechococcaceae cyanobacterium]
MDHLLERLELELTSGDETLGRGLLDRFSRPRVRRALTEALERVLEQLSPPGCQHRIETLELDLGVVAADDLERQLPLALERALWRALPPLLPGALLAVTEVDAAKRAEAEGPEAELASARQARAGATNAERGGWGEGPRASSTLGDRPRGAAAQGDDPLRATLAALLGLPAETAAALLERLAPTASAREQLLAAADPGQRQPLRRLLSANGASAGEDAASADDAEIGVGEDEAGPTEREGGPMDLILPEVRGLELLAWFATRGNLPWWAPRHEPRLVSQAIEEALSLPRTELSRFLRQLAIAQAASQAGVAGAPAVAAAGGGQGEPAAPGASLHPTGTQGSGPELAPRAGAWPPWASTPLARLLRAAEAQQRPRLRQALAEVLPEALALGFPVPEEQLPSADQGASPPDASASSTNSALMLRLPAPGRLAPHSQPAASAPSAALRLPPPEAALTPGAEILGGASPLPTSLEAAATPPSQRARPNGRGAEASSASRQPSLPRPLARSEGLSVEGAGVVLLWPFLETLLRRLALLDDDGRFVGPAERQQALALLGFLVDGDPRPPEWRLGLAKPLCGMALEELGGLEEPLGAAERREAEGLLAAALAHAEGLLGDDLETLRERWLQRPGLLEQRPGCWLLVVERREGDGLLEALPWSWDWIRLPWMAELLQVAW